MAYQSFEELEVWKRGCALAVFVHGSFMNTREYAMRDQMVRSSISVPSNIAEGYERSAKDFCRFLAIALGSCAELRTQAYIARKIEAITAEQMSHIVDESKQLSRMLRSLSNSRKKDTVKPEG